MQAARDEREKLLPQARKSGQSQSLASSDPAYLDLVTFLLLAPQGERIRHLCIFFSTYTQRANIPRVTSIKTSLARISAPRVSFQLTTTTGR